MRLLLAAFGRILVDLAVMETPDTGDDDEDDGGSASLSAHVERAGPYPLGFTAEPAPDRWPFYD